MLEDCLAPVRRPPYTSPGRRRAIERIGLIAALCCAATTVAADTLPLAAAERVAIERDPMLLQFAAEAGSQRELAVAAAELPDPRLRFGAVNVPVDTFSLTNEDMTMLEVGVSQEFGRGERRNLARRQLEQASTAAESLADERRRDITRELRTVWTELAYLTRARELNQAQYEWVEQLRRSARSRYAAGEGRQLDLLRAGLDAAMLRESALDLEREAERKRVELVRWLGAEDAARAGPFMLSEFEALPPLAQLEQALAVHPAQVEVQRRLDAAQTGVEFARTATRPAWMLDFSYGFRSGEESDGESRPDMVSAMVSVDLPLFRADRQHRELAAAQGDLRALEHQREDRRRDLQAQLGRAWAEAHRSEDLLRFYVDELQPLAEQSVQAALLAWRNDRGGIDDAVEARQLALETQLRRARLQADRLLAQHEIDYLTGEQP